MEKVLFAALAVGGATVLGAVIGYIFGNACLRVQRYLMAFAAGVMLEASTVGLLCSALGDGGLGSALTVGAGVLIGAVLILLLGRITAKLCKGRKRGDELSRTLLFVMAIALHNIPEGLAAGVGFGAGGGGEGITVSLAIALQNLPEGMAVVGPMLAVGIKPKRAFVYAALTGVIETVCTLLGFLMTSVAALPLLLSVAAGTMIAVTAGEMIPEGDGATLSLSLGVAVMLIIGGLF